MPSVADALLQRKYCLKALCALRLNPIDTKMTAAPGVGARNVGMTKGTTAWTQGIERSRSRSRGSHFAQPSGCPIGVSAMDVRMTKWQEAILHSRQAAP